MRLSIRHETHHRYERPAKAITQTLRLTPRAHEGQHIAHWRIDLDVECRLRSSQDAFGNIVHGFTLDGPLAALTVTAIGEVETFDTRGVILGTLERFPPELYLRETSLTQATPAARALAAEAMAAGANDLDRLHALLRSMSQAGAAPEAPALSGGQAQTQSQGDEPQAPSSPEAQTHLFIAGVRLMNVPTRYVAGYRKPDTAETLSERHGWAEAFVRDLGWVGFDPVSGHCPDERYVRVAVGLDALGATAMRGAHSGGADHPAEVKLIVAEARWRDYG